MIRDVLQSANLTAWPVFSVVLFFSVSLFMLLWITRKGSGETYRRISLAPLQDDSLEAKIPNDEK